MVDYLKIANSWPVWLCAFIGVGCVLVQSVIYTRLAYKNAPAAGLTSAQCSRGLKSGLISAIGPSISVFVVVFSMVAIVGGPISWMRLSMIGGSGTELTAATIGANAVGAAIGSESYDIYAMAASWWTMAVNGCGWLLMVALFTHRMEKVRARIGGGDPRWLSLLTAAATLGLFGYMAAPYVLKLHGSMVAALLGFGSMLGFMKLSQKQTWLKEYALGFAIIVGMIGGAVVG
ncbi:DUF5058 family protein [Anaerotruncus sp. DFI.9.16]|uniref:DUF5058 family protein n=1 Tax=Anaerotruncus sp. DFI.9.16 TaxID=2965275 RepID=UPI00210AFAE3|nr:DUF5058 family protein [Anaerotruncus sp. DFI.9.16]MCQ4895634.1 DUF5058 family protein [Anaerotruncus sp. DFI.9.16]